VRGGPARANGVKKIHWPPQGVESRKREEEGPQCRKLRTGSRGRGGQKGSAKTDGTVVPKDLLVWGRGPVHSRDLKNHNDTGGEKEKKEGQNETKKGGQYQHIIQRQGVLSPPP